MKIGIYSRAFATAIIGATLAGCAPEAASQPDSNEMSFFVTSRGSDNGANFGGLEGADNHCQALAQEVGAGNRTWRAYLSTQAGALNDPNFINARDRIGTGPWYNANGVMVARDIEDLHSQNNNMNLQTILTEQGSQVNGRGESPNQHDILTGSRPDGTAYPGQPFGDRTCSNWTSSSPEGSAIVGHHDREGPIDASWASSWNSAHPSRGCHAEGLVSTGGAGLLYCFAAD